MIQCKAGSSYKKQSAKLIRELVGTMILEKYNYAYLVGTWEDQLPNQIMKITENV